MQVLKLLCIVWVAAPAHGHDAKAQAWLPQPWPRTWPRPWLQRRPHPRALGHTHGHCINHSHNYKKRLWAWHDNLPCSPAHYCYRRICRDAFTSSHHQTALYLLVTSPPEYLPFSTIDPPPRAYYHNHYGCNCGQCIPHPFSSSR